MKITRCDQFNLALSQGAYAWPGGYPIYFLCADGEALSFDAAIENAALIRDAIIGADNTGGWRVVGCGVSWEDGALFCADTNKRIESAYAELDADCAKGIHSWSDAIGRLPPDTPCARCGELYGNPE